MKKYLVNSNSFPYLCIKLLIMNKIWNSLTGTANERKEPENRKPKTSGKLFDWCSEKLNPLGLRISNVTPYSLAVYRGGDVVGYYNTLTEIKEAINGGYVNEPHNL